VVGGVIPARDHAELSRLGVRRVFTPKDYRLVEIVGALVDLAGDEGGEAATRPAGG
jgi:(2R)-ethylmalonyl-CoA mutase